MSIKQILAKISFCQKYCLSNPKWANNPVKRNKKFLKTLSTSTAYTICSDHFLTIKNFDDFVKQVPIRDYEGLKPYIEQVVAGKRGCFMGRKLIYFAKTSRPQAGQNYIPITTDLMPFAIKLPCKCHIYIYMNETKNTSFIDGKK